MKHCSIDGVNPSRKYNSSEREDMSDHAKAKRLAHAFISRLFSRGALWIMLGAFTLGFLFTTSCSSVKKTDKTVAMDEAKVVNGVIVDADSSGGMEKMAKELDAMDLKASQENTRASANRANRSARKSPKNIRPLDAVGMAKTQGIPQGATGLISLPKLSAKETQDLSDRLVLSLSAEHGYEAAPTTVADSLSLAPKGVTDEQVLVKATEQATHVLRFGIRRFVSQPPQFWTMGVIIDKAGTLTVNPDLKLIEPATQKMIEELNKLRAGLTVRDLEKKLIQLSYVDAKTALAMLKGMGIMTIDMSDLKKPETIPAKVEFDKLPFVVATPDPAKEDTGLIGANAKTSGQLGLSLTPGVATDITANPVAGPLTQLMVLFHPAHPEQFSGVRQMIDTFIDRPARQIFIEGMVLEISERGLKDLGIDWALLNSGPLSVTSLGTLNAGSESSSLTNYSADTLDAAVVTDVSKLHNIFKGDFLVNWSATVRALVRTGKAEILSRPSVLTLNNRQATIRVGQDIPILSSTEGMSVSSNKLVFKFTYLSTGILMNIRPRINEDGTEVSMLIDTIVSAEVPNEGLVVYASNSPTQKLAEAPRISTRRVQTYGRIRNNTPFIIGGLVAKDKTSTQDKIPILGDLPWVGAAFRSTKNESTKREVIIVLTPYILPEKKLIPRSLPKDEDLFDSFGHELFRDSYRIRSEDVFDLSFLLENPRIVNYRKDARQMIEGNFRLGEIEPFRTFVRDSIPGEEILVTRMVYEVIKRLSLDNPVQASRLIFLESQQQGGGYSVKYLEALLAEHSKGKFKGLEGKAIAVTFSDDPSELEGSMDNASLPEVSLIDCPGRKAWGTLLWALNQPTPDGKLRHTVLIQDESDITRLRRAQPLTKIITLNGGAAQMRLRNFSVGKVLLMPEMRPDQTHLIDAESARFFFHTEHYYAATLQEIEAKLTELDGMLNGEPLPMSGE